MFAWLTGSSLKFRRLVIPLAIGLIVFGITQSGDIDRDTLPEFAPTMVEVQTEALGLSAEEVEQLVTSPLEQDLLNGVAFLQHIESASLPGLSSVVMTFEPGTPVLDARQVVAERLTQAVGAAGLPQVASLPQMLQPLSSSSRVAMVSMRSETATDIEMSVLARWLVSPTLLGVEGVANVSIWGFRDRQLQVLVDPAELASQDVDLSQVISTAGNSLEVSPLSFLEASTPGTGGFIDTPNQRLHIFHEQAISNPDQLGAVPLDGPDGEQVLRFGAPVTLGDVSEIVEDHQPLIGDAMCGDGPCLLLVIEKFPAENTPEVVADIEDAVANLTPALPGIEVDTSLYRPAEVITTALDQLALVVGVGGAFALLLLAFLIFDWRTIAVAVLTAFTSIGVVLAVMILGDITINLFLVAGVVLAILPIIDDAVTNAQMIHQERDDLPGDPDRFAFWRAIMGASLESRRVGIYGTMIVLAIGSPLLFLQGEGGAFVPPVLVGYVIGAAAGFLSASVIAPAASMLLFEHQRPSSASGEHVAASAALGPLGSRIIARYGSALDRQLDRPRPLIVATIGVVVLGIVSLPFLQTSLRPSLQERDLMVKLTAAPGTGLEAMTDTATSMVADMRAVTGVEDAVAHVGRAISSDQIVNVNSAAVWVAIADDAVYSDTRALVDEVTDRYESVSPETITYTDERASQILGRDVSGLVVRVYGDEADGLASGADQISTALTEIEGVETATAEQPISQETVEIEVDIERAQALGLKPGDVRRTAAILISGITVGNLFEEQKVFDVVVWGQPELRSSMDAVRALLITTPTGEQVPLSEVADVRVVPNPSVIRHESVSTFVDVAIGVTDGYDPAAVATSVDQAIAGAEFTLGLHAELLGGFAVERSARTTVVWLAIAAMLTAYLLFQAAFTSWRLALLAILGIPVTMATGLIALTITGRDLSLGALVGVVAGSGLAIRGSVLLIRRYQDLERHGTPFGTTLVSAGSRDRVGPILATTIASLAFFLPMAVMSGSAGLEVVGPMAVAVVGCAIGAAAFSMLLLPALHLRWGRVTNPDTAADDLFTVDIREPDRVRL